jgi:hypothetical protein
VTSRNNMEWGGIRSQRGMAPDVYSEGAGLQCQIILRFLVVLLSPYRLMLEGTWSARRPFR